MSRRAMFTLPAVRYQPVASIREADCSAETGCRVCISVCPFEALVGDRSRVTLDRDKCTGCGICVTECPGLAIDLPSHSVDQSWAELTALLETPCPTAQKRAILFICEANVAMLPALAAYQLPESLVWLPIRLPCAGMVPGAWIIGALAGGADTVFVIGCGESWGIRQDERISGRVAYCRELLARGNGSPQRVVHLPGPDVLKLAGALTESLSAERPMAPTLIESLPAAGPNMMAATTLALARTYGSDFDVSFTHPASPHGLVHIDGRACTACERCAAVCPTGALTVQRSDGSIAIDFDATLCTPCELCTGQCPESIQEAIGVDRVTDGIALRRGRVTLHQDLEVRCTSCGAVIASRAMIQRIAALVTADGETNSATMESVLSRCPDCRVATPFGRA